MSDTPNNGTVNLTLDALSGGAPVSTNRSVTREEQRARSRQQSTSARASQIFNAMRGEDAAPSEPTQQPESEPTQEPDAPEVVDSAEPPAEPEQDSDAPSADELPETLEALTKHLDLDASYVESLRVKVKMDGEEREISLGEAIKNTQFAQANHEARARINADQRRMEAVAAEQMQTYNQLVEQGKRQHRAAAYVLQQELQSPEVQALKAQDPGAYLHWQGIVEKRLAGLNSSFQQLEAQHQQALQAHQEQVRQAGLSRLRQEITDFDTPERYQKISKVFSDFGVSEQEAGAILDDRVVLFASKYADMAERLAKLEAEQQRDTKRARQVVDKANTSRPATPQNASRASKQRVQAAKTAMKGKKGHAGRQAKAAAINAILREGRRGRR